MRKNSSVRGQEFTVRGCDHTFLCELISETANTKNIVYDDGVTGYCMDNVKYINFFGYFCCCNNDHWCNKHSKAEEVSDERILEDLIQGITSVEKWQKLQEIAEKHEEAR